MKAYPVPAAQRWTVAVHFHDGDRIAGTSATDVLERWGRRMVWALPASTATDLPVAQVKRVLAARLDSLAMSPTPVGADDDSFLDHLDAIGVCRVIRR